MPASQRWNSIYSSFRSGQLSPAAQDDLSSDLWQNGAAKITNFRIERDGGLSPRPALRRAVDAQDGSLLTIDVPTRGLLAGGQVQRGTGETVVAPPMAEPIAIPRDFYDTPSEFGAPYGRDGGVLWLGDGPRPRTFATGGSAQDTALLRVLMPEPVLARSFTFHGVRLTEGTLTHNVDGIERLNLAVWLGYDAGNPTDGRYAPSDLGAPEDEGLLTPGAFSPGTVRRDIVVPLDRNLPLGGDVLPIQYVELHTRRTGVATTVSIDGVSCFGAEAGQGAALPAGLLDRPYRIIPWPIRGIPFVLMLGMDHVRLVQLFHAESRQPQSRVSGTAIWHFTVRQLRELTWATFGGGLLLCHHDFPHPLHVEIPLSAQARQRLSLVIQPLDLRNIPFVTQELTERGLPDISTVGGSIVLAPTGIPGDAPVPSIGRWLTRVVLGETRTRITWTDTAADVYDVEYRILGSRQTLAADTTTNTLLLTELVPGTIYEVRRRASVVANASAWSPYSTFETLKQLAAPDAPTLTAPARGTALTEGELGVSWNAVGDADYYELLVSGVPTPITVRGRRTTLTLAAGPSYDVRVRAVSDPERRQDLPEHWAEPSRGPFSDPSSLVLRNFKPGRVGRPEVGAGAGSGEVDVTWPAVLGADRYELEYQQFAGTVDPTFARGVSVTVTGNSATFTGVVGRNYIVRVRAIRDHADVGDWSDVVGYIPIGGSRADGPRVTVRSVAGVPGRFQITWTDIDGATEYTGAVRVLGTEDWTESTHNRTTWTYPGEINTAYEFRVRDARENGVWSDIVQSTWSATGGTDTTDTGIPSLAVQDGAADNQLLASWSDVAGADGYELDWREGEEGWTTVDRTASQLAYLHTGTSGQSYGFRVKATFADAPDGEYSEIVTRTASPRATGAPQNVRTRGQRIGETGAANGNTVVSWDRVQHATGYLVEQYSNAELTTRTASHGTTGRDARVVVIGGTTGTRYWYRVRARRSGAADGPWSGVVSAVAQDLTSARDVGPVLTVDDGDDRTKADLSWTELVGAQRYRVESATGTDDFSVVVNTADGTTRTHTFTGVSGTTERFRVRASLGPGMPSAWSDEVTHYFRQAGPTLSATDGDADGEVDLSWTAVAGRSAYRVDVRPEGGVWTPISGVDHSARTATYPGQTGQTYDFRVRSTAVLSDQIPASEWSDEVEHTARKSGPVLTAAGGLVAGRVELSWTAVPDATSYRVESRTGTNAFAALVASQTTRTYTHNTTPGETRDYRVRATTPDGDTAWSRVETFTAPVGITTAPTGTLVLAEHTALSIRLDEITGATQYAWRPVVGGTPGDHVNLEEGSRELRRTGLTQNTGYPMQFRAGNSLGDGPWSATQTFTTTGTGLGPITNFRGVGGTAALPTAPGGRTAAVALRGDLPDGATGYQIQWSRRADFSSYSISRIYTAGVSRGRMAVRVRAQRNSPTLATNTGYFFRARATGANDTTGPWTDPVFFLGVDVRIVDRQGNVVGGWTGGLGTPSLPSGVTSVDPVTRSAVDAVSVYAGEYGVDLSGTPFGSVSGFQAVIDRVGLQGALSIASATILAKADEATGDGGGGNDISGEGTGEGNAVDGYGPGR